MQLNEIIKNNNVFIERIASRRFQSNTYVIASNKTKDASIIDPVLPAEQIKDVIRNHNFKLNYIINTHGHIDHIEADGEFDIPVLIHKDDEIFLSKPELNLSQFILGSSFIFTKSRKLLADGEIIKIGHINLRVIHTPGHTPGSICLYLDNLIFSGDTLFLNGVGRCDCPQGSEKQLLESIKQKLLNLPDETLVLPGHGSRTTLGREKKFNPFINNL